MTDKELIQAVKNCKNTVCYKCQIHKEHGGCFDAVFNRLEWLQQPCEEGTV